MRRNIYNSLIEWKNRKGHKPLVLLGARQVGKTWILNEFGENEYENIAYLNCDRNIRLKEAFFDYDTDRLIRSFSALSGITIQPKTTLIILDEIQEIPEAMTSLKYFCENAPDYDIVVAGSLLGLSIHTGTGYPVGKVEELTLYPMTFSEFMDACGENDLQEYVQYAHYDELRILKDKLIDLLRQYYYVGGMPEVVKNFVENKDLSQVRKIQNQILKDYKKDFSKHIPRIQLSKVNEIWASIPSQLAKENKKFIYGKIKTGARAREYEDAIQWLIDAGVILKVYRINKVEMPIGFYIDINSFKLFVSDLGLLGAMTNAPADRILVGNGAFIEYKGAFTEQYVAQTLFAEDVKPYYFTNEKSTLETDFVVQLDEVYPIEVKAEENLRSKSLKSVVNSGKELTGCRFSMADYREQDWMVNIPLYAIEKWIKEKNEQANRKYN